MQYWTILCIYLILLLSSLSCYGIQLTAYISQSGIHGTVHFNEYSAESNDVLVQVELQVAEEYSEWSWHICEFPVYYTNLEDRCSERRLGARLVSLDDIAGLLSFPNSSSTEFTVPKSSLSLVGPTGIWGRSLILVSTDGRRACSTVTISGEADEKVAEAKFFSPIAGSVFFRWAGSQRSNSVDALIHVNIYRVMKSKWTLPDDTSHNWKIFATDILDSEADKARENCNFLQIVFDPNSAPKGEAIGDIDNRLGKINISKILGQSLKSVYHDPLLNAVSVSLLDNRRSLYLVIFDSRHHDSFLACAKIREVIPTTYKAIVNSKGIKGEVTFTQRSVFDPSWIDFNLSHTTNEDVRVSTFKVHELPPLPYEEVGKNPCLKTGKIFNPTDISEDEGSASQDTYAIGDLSGKHNMWRNELRLKELSQRYWDINLPIQGPNSIGHRSLVFYRDEGEKKYPEMCMTLLQYQGNHKNWKMPMFTADIVFRYPVVGRIVLRQPKEQYWLDTTIIIETLVHGDGTSLNNTEEHRWLVHELPPGKDFYDWQNRCLSAGTPFNPYKVEFNEDNQELQCNSFQPGTCRLGDLSTRLGTLRIAGRRVNGTRFTRRLFTDSQLPLSGPGSILGRSLVLYDDHGPKARGERLACSPITARYRRKAVVKSWHGNGEDTSVKGKIEIFQQSEYDTTDVEIDVEGLIDTSGYHIHVVPVQANLEFPCEESTLYGFWNPRNVNHKLSPPPKEGTVDQYEMGDLSGKFGLLDNLSSIITTYNDTDLPLFGPYSILGRSVVITKKVKNRRWVCSTIERGYSPSEAREIRAIASFHHPLGFAYGYIRMTQLIYFDGSASDTVIEVSLRHPGKNDRNLTRNHNWAIFVNPVGVDASVQILNTRCVAGGYVWNPYYTQLAAPRDEELYREECGPDNPLRCYVGDISGRLGTINIGDQRQVFTDSNFPLEGRESAVGRSIVILNKDHGSERFACANIEPDHDIIKYVNLGRPPKFVMAQFLQDVREVMGIPEWMLSVDSQKTKLLHNRACVQFLLHFKGPAANRLEQDFNRLINSGKLASPSLYIPGYVPKAKRKTTLSYRPCGSRDPNERRSRSRGTYIGVHYCIILLALMVVNNI